MTPPCPKCSTDRDPGSPPAQILAVPVWNASYRRWGTATVACNQMVDPWTKEDQQSGTFRVECGVALTRATCTDLGCKDANCHHRKKPPLGSIADVPDQHDPTLGLTIPANLVRRMNHRELTHLYWWLQWGHAEHAAGRSIALLRERVEETFDFTESPTAALYPGIPGRGLWRHVLAGPGEGRERRMAHVGGLIR